MIPFNISINGKTSHARWYPKPDRIVINVNKIAEIHNPETEFEEFISEFCACEFHELAHIYGYRNGCHPPSKCREGKCYLCRITLHIFAWFAVDFYLRNKR